MKGKKILFIVVLSFLLIPKVSASSCNVKANTTNIKQGDTVTISLSGQDVIGKFNISSSSILTSSQNSIWIENNTETISFTANSSGVATINVSPFQPSDGQGNDINLSCNSVSITINPKNTPQPSNNSNKGTSQKSNSNKPSKSNNNYLKSFGVEGYNLPSEFNKDNGDYSVTVPYDTKEVQVIYEKEDDKASISGDEGVKSVSVGENKFTITVTAENGEQRNYTVNVIVEKKPIIIKKNNDEYSVVTKEEDLPKIDIEHDVITLNIQDTEVKAYRIDSIDYVLIALRDKNNDVKLYKFDSFKDDEKEPIYTLYQDINLSGIYLVLTEPKSIPSGYKKVSIKINGNSVSAYKKNKGFYLVYGLNTSNNKKSFYSYDEGENTLQRYNIEELNDTLKENDTLKKFAFLLCIGLIAAFIIIIIICVKKCENKEAKELRKEEKKNKKLEIQNQKKETKKQRKEEKRLKKEAKKVEDKVEDDE